MEDLSGFRYTEPKVCSGNAVFETDVEGSGLSAECRPMLW